MTFKRRIEALERLRLTPIQVGMTLSDWTDKEIDQAIELILSGEKWPLELQAKQEKTYFPPSDLTDDQLHRRINELLVISGRQPMYFE